MTDDSGIPRRKVLAALGTVGTAGALGGAGTYALFSDRENLAASFMAGKLDLAVHYTSFYNGAKTGDGTVDVNRATLFDRTDVIPGDQGRTEFCFELHTNPAYLWLCGEITADREGDNSQEDGELDEKIQATLRYCSSDGTDGAVIVDGTLGEVMDALSEGVPLDYNGNDVSAGQQAPYQPSSEAGAITGPCVCIKWEIPLNEVGNEIQSDELDIAFRFNAIQARHNDGTGSPCGDGNGGGGGGGDGGNGDSGDDDNGGGGDDNGGSNKVGISYIAFCDFNGNTKSLKPTVTVLETNDGGDAITVHWETNKKVGHVALKTGNQDHPGKGNKWESYFDHFYPDSTSGTVTVGMGTDVQGQHPSDPCPNGEEVKVKSSEFVT